MRKTTSILNELFIKILRQGAAPATPQGAVEPPANYA